MAATIYLGPILVLIALILANVWILVMAVLFLQNARQAHKEAQLFVQTVEERTRKEQNKIASLSVEEFHTFITRMFSRMIELSASANVSIKDPDVYERLYGFSYKRLEDYLGEDTLAAIRYHYGDNYLSEFCRTSFMLLATRRGLSSIVTDRATGESIAHTMTRETQL